MNKLAFSWIAMLLFIQFMIIIIHDLIEIYQLMSLNI